MTKIWTTMSVTSSKSNATCRLWFVKVVPHGYAWTRKSREQIRVRLSIDLPLSKYLYYTIVPSWLVTKGHILLNMSIKMFMYAHQSFQDIDVFGVLL